MSRFSSLLLFGAVTSAAPLFAAVTVQLSSSLPSPQKLGTVVTFTANAADANGGKFDFQFSVARNALHSQIIEDYDISNKLLFAPYLKEGNYTVQVTARDQTTQETGSTTLTFSYSPRAISAPVASPTANSLVALYSAPACASGSTMYVRFKTGSIANNTSQQTCDGSTSMNWYIAGMLANTTYTLTGVTVTNGVSKPGTPVNFTTRGIPATVPIPPISLLRPVDGSTDTAQSVLLMDTKGNGTFDYPPIATDLQGNVLWFYPNLATDNQASTFALRPVPNSLGDILLIMNNANVVLSPQGQVLREIDLAGNTVRQTSAARVNEQLAAMGKYPINDFDHDMSRLPNGHTLVIGSQEQIFPAGTQGSTGPIDILGDAIIDLDQDLQVAWSWSGYDHLDISRKAILAETCTNTQAGCPPVLLASIANDWLHGNSINYIPASGDLLFSMRHQDWVAKIDYNNGTGSGVVIWELGLDGNFTIISNDVYPWFSHQHDVEYELNSTNFLSLFDNGNTRVFRDGPGDSRGQYLNVDETNFLVTPIVSADLGVYSGAVGSAQLLDNGNLHFDAGIINGSGSQAIEVLPDGTLGYTLQANTVAYRSYRMESLYKLGH